MNTQLFRPQAVAHHELGEDEFPPLDLTDRPSKWGFRLLLAGLLVVCTAAVTLHADESAEGNAVVQQGARTAQVRLPYGALGLLRPGLPVRIRLDGRAGEVDGQVVTIGEPIAGHDERGNPQAVVPVDVGLTTTTGLRVGQHGVATVRLARRPVVTLLVPGLRRLTGNADA